MSNNYNNSESQVIRPASYHAHATDYIEPNDITSSSNRTSASITEVEHKSKEEIARLTFRCDLLTLKVEKEKLQIEKKISHEEKKILSIEKLKLASEETERIQKLKQDYDSRWNALQSEHNRVLDINSSLKRKLECLENKHEKVLNEKQSEIKRLYEENQQLKGERRKQKEHEDQDESLLSSSDDDNLNTFFMDSFATLEQELAQKLEQQWNERLKSIQQKKRLQEQENLIEKKNLHQQLLSIQESLKIVKERQQQVQAHVQKKRRGNRDMHPNDNVDHFRTQHDNGDDESIHLEQHQDIQKGSTKLHSFNLPTESPSHVTSSDKSTNITTNNFNNDTGKNNCHKKTSMDNHKTTTLNNSNAISDQSRERQQRDVMTQHHQECRHHQHQQLYHDENEIDVESVDKSEVKADTAKEGNNNDQETDSNDNELLLFDESYASNINKEQDDDDEDEEKQFIEETENLLDDNHDNVTQTRKQSNDTIATPPPPPHTTTSTTPVNQTPTSPSKTSSMNINFSMNNHRHESSNDIAIENNRDNNEDDECLCTLPSPLPSPPTRNSNDDTGKEILKEMNNVDVYQQSKVKLILMCKVNDEQLCITSDDVKGSIRVTRVEDGQLMAILYNHCSSSIITSMSVVPLTKLIRNENNRSIQYEQKSSFGLLEKDVLLACASSGGKLWFTSLKTYKMIGRVHKFNSPIMKMLSYQHNIIHSQKDENHRFLKGKRTILALGMADGNIQLWDVKASSNTAHLGTEKDGLIGMEIFTCKEAEEGGGEITNNDERKQYLVAASMPSRNMYIVSLKNRDYDLISTIYLNDYIVDMNTKRDDEANYDSVQCCFTVFDYGENGEDTVIAVASVNHQEKKYSILLFNRLSGFNLMHKFINPNLNGLRSRSIQSIRARTTTRNNNTVSTMIMTEHDNNIRTKSPNCLRFWKVCSDTLKLVSTIHIGDELISRFGPTCVLAIPSQEQRRRQQQSRQQQQEDGADSESSNNLLNDEILLAIGFETGKLMLWTNDEDRIRRRNNSIESITSRRRANSTSSLASTGTSNNRRKNSMSSTASNNTINSRRKNSIGSPSSISKSNKRKNSVSSTSSSRKSTRS